MEAEGLGRRYGSLRALVDLDFEIRAGESLAIFGPNGAGKTTLVKLLATLFASDLGPAADLRRGAAGGRSCAAGSAGSATGASSTAS